MPRCRTLDIAITAVMLSLAAASRLAAQQPAEDEATRLAKASQNPVGDLMSLPFQFNFNTGGAFADRTFFNLNFQPVVPIKGGAARLDHHQPHHRALRGAFRRRTERGRPGSATSSSR